MSESPYSALVAAFPLPTLVIAADRRIGAVNNAMSAVLGRGLIGVNYITALRRPALLKAVEAIFDGAASQSVQYLGRDGNTDTTYRVTLSGVDDAVMLVFEDQSAAAEIGKLRRDFVANVSHELRTPLTALSGFIETLQGPARNDTAAQQRFLGIMAQEAGRMRQLVDDLLSLSRVEEDERVRPTQMVDVSVLISSVIAGLEPLARGAKTALVYNPPSQAVNVPADDTQLRQVLTNLIGNAVKYGANPEGIVITLTGPAPEPLLQSEGIRITVRDFGDGIAAHHIARLTERFYRIDTHRSREVGGTGLGLAIAKHIVSRHRGRLQIESEMGQGAAFTVILPTILS